MSYISIMDLPELFLDETTGDEYLLVTNADVQSNKLQMNTLTGFVTGKVVQNINDSIDARLDAAIQNSKVTVYDEGIQVGTANKINFIGATVNSFVNDEDSSIDVYIPSASMSSNFNTNNGSTNAIIQNAVFTERYIAAPIFDGAPFKIGDWQAGSLQKCVKDNLTYSTPEKFYVDKSSLIRLYIIQDNLEIDKLEIPTINGSYNSLYISATISGKTKELSHYSAMFSCSFNLKSSIKGRFKIKIQYIGVNTFTFEENELFFDNDNLTASLTMNNSFSNNIFSYLSGIKYLTTGTQIKTNIKLVNSKYYTYPLNICDIDETAAGAGLHNLTPIDITNFNNQYNTDIEFFKEFPILPNKFFNGDLIIKSRVNDWTTGTYMFETIRGLINTFTDNSTRVYEDFNNENLRLKNDFTTFNSQELLDVGYLQVYNSRLVYPQLDFSEFYNNPNYSNKIGNRSYLRKFWHNNISHSNGIIQLSSNITESDLLSENVKIEISLDAVNWFNCNKDYIGGVINNNGNCRINSDTNNLNINNKIEFSLGLNKFTNASSNWGIFLKITFNENVKDKYIDNIQIINWN